MRGRHRGLVLVPTSTSPHPVPVVVVATHENLTAGKAPEDVRPFDEYHELVDVGRTCRRDALGRLSHGARGSTGWPWTILICNNPGCHARVDVRQDILVRTAEHALWEYAMDATEGTR